MASDRRKQSDQAAAALAAVRKAIDAARGSARRVSAVKFDPAGLTGGAAQAVLRQLRVAGHEITPFDVYDAKRDVMSTHYLVSVEPREVLAPVDARTLRLTLADLREYPPLLRVAASLYLCGYRERHLLATPHVGEDPKQPSMTEADKVTLANYLRDFEGGWRPLDPALASKTRDLPTLNGPPKP
jgi:hypothetical protein